MLQRSLCTLACTMVAGCLGEPAPDTTVMASAREQFMTNAWPALAGCAGCHGTQPAIGFLAPGTPDGAYQTMFEFQPPVIDVDVPATSLVLTMGKHTGPALSPDPAARILSWLEAEREERAMPGGMTTRIGPFLPEHGTPIVLGLGVGSATLTIVTEPSEGGLYARRITVASGTGVRVAHPLFVSRPPHPVLDELDRFSELELDLRAGETAELGPAWFVGFDPNDYVSIHFQTLEAPR